MTRALLFLVAVTGCDWSLHRMVDQPRCEADEATQLLPRGACNQPPPAGSVAYRPRGEAPLAPPPPRTRALLERGRDRFDIFCAPCHGVLGDGSSQVAENMLLRRPPSLQEERIVQLGDDRLFQIVTAGYGLMPAYASMLAPTDRWAVVGYVRALQLSQGAVLDELPAPFREEAQPWLN